MAADIIWGITFYYIISLELRWQKIYASLFLWKVKARQQHKQRV